MTSVQCAELTFYSHYMSVLAQTSQAGNRRRQRFVERRNFVEYSSVRPHTDIIIYQHLSCLSNAKLDTKDTEFVLLMLLANAKLS